MRTRYLVFDADCPVCDTLAKTTAASSDGKLQTLSIQSGKARALLEQAYPTGWDFAPYLIVVDSEQVKVWKGFRAAFRLAILLGPRKALRLWKLARQNKALSPINRQMTARYDQARRQVLKGLMGISLGGLLSKILGLQVTRVQTAYANHNCDVCYPGEPCYGGDSSTGCICEEACGWSCPSSCSPVCPDYYHQLWCQCHGGQIKPCVRIECGKCDWA